MASVHPGRLHFHSQSGAGSISSDKEASHVIPQKQDSSHSLGPADGRGFYDSQVSQDGYVVGTIFLYLISQPPDTVMWNCEQ